MEDRGKAMGSLWATHCVYCGCGNMERITLVLALVENRKVGGITIILIKGATGSSVRRRDTLVLMGLPAPCCVT